jgi:hypothetical protein
MLRLSAAMLVCAFSAAAAAGSLIAPTLADIAQQRATTKAGLKGKAKIKFTDGLSQAWTARSSAKWLVIDTPSGTGPGALKYHVDAKAASAAVVNWDAVTATVTISSPGLADAISPLTFRRQLPEVTMLTPAQVLPGQAATLTLSGKGFSQIDAIGEITVGGVPVTSGTIVSDTQATVQLPAQAAGALQVQVPNSLKQPAAQAQVAVAAALAYASVPTPGNTSKTSMVYDPSRQTVFASDYYGAALERYTFDGTSWSLQVVPWDGAWRVQMSPDRRTLFVLGTNGLAEVDPDTLAVRVMHPEMTGYQGFYYYNPLPLTNDLLLWGPEGTKYFDLRHGFFGDAAGAFGGVGAEDLVQTPDGAHLYATEGSYSPAPPNGWFSAATHTTKALPAGLLNFTYYAAFDAMGKKGVFGGNAVYSTADWSLVGKIQAPAGMWNFGNALMSPDGRRVYALSASNSGSQADRVSVYDTTQLQAGTSNLVLLGTILVANRAATCNGEYACDTLGRFAIDATGSELFWAGNGAFTVIPIPAALR